MIDDQWSPSGGSDAFIRSVDFSHLRLVSVRDTDDE